MKKLWNKNYILMLQGSAVSALGDILYSVAIGLWVYEKTNSSTLCDVRTDVCRRLLQQPVKCHI